MILTISLFLLAFAVSMVADYLLLRRIESTERAVVKHSDFAADIDTSVMNLKRRVMNLECPPPKPKRTRKPRTQPTVQS